MDLDKKKKCIATLHTVFPPIVSGATILFWIWPYVLWPKVTVYKSAQTIQGRKLFKGGNYSREETIQGRKLSAEIRYYKIVLKLTIKEWPESYSRWGGTFKIRFFFIEFALSIKVKEICLQHFGLSCCRSGQQSGKGPFINYVCIFWNFLTTYTPSLHFLCSKLHVFLTTYPP